MGKELFFVRHSLARDPYRGQADAERELTDGGAIRAMQLANHLKNTGCKVDALFSSDAARARRTAELLAEKVLGGQQEIVFHQDLYESSVRLMLSLINQLDDSWQKVMLVGHNPIIPYTVEFLTGAIVEQLEPAGVLVLKTDASSWAEISGKTMDVKEYIAPAIYAQV